MAIDVWNVQAREQLLTELTDACDYCRGQAEALKRQDPLLVVICGAFSTGKSSLINALLGCRLPTGTNPITKTVTKLVYGKHERILLENIKTGKSSVISQETAEKMILDSSNQGFNSTYRVCYEIDSSLLKAGLVIVDTPGFQDDATGKLDKVTQAEIAKADFCIVNFSCNHFGSSNERQFMEKLQTLTNGNFAMVLNCSNYLNGLSALEDLQKRADYILKPFGNDRIGYGKYYIVDSLMRPAYLDGLDQWLSENLLRYARQIRRETVQTRTKQRVTESLQQGDEAFWETMSVIQNSMEYWRSGMERKLRSTEAGNHDRIQAFRKLQNQKMQSLPAEVLDIIRSKLTALSKDNFNEKAFQMIEESLNLYSGRLQTAMAKAFPETADVDAAQYTEGVKMRQTRVETYKRARSVFDLDRYLLGAYEYYTNDYLNATIQDQREVTIPDLRQHMDRYFADAEKRLMISLCIQQVRRENRDVESLTAFAEGLGEKLLLLRDLGARMAAS